MSASTGPAERAASPAAASPRGRVVSVNVARARLVEIGGRDIATGIFKRAVDGAVAVGPLGLAGDEQADPSVHGGLAKALYAYPTEHYAFWRTVRTQAAGADRREPARFDAADDALTPGALGENLSLAGLLERDAFIGDRLRFADCELAVSEPRLPCFKFNAAMGFAQAARLMVQSGWCGFYLSVVRPGTLRAGEAFELLPGPREVGIDELFRSRTRAGAAR